ncbi:unnamed protein product [Effrenium voratum]|nr:unnamed protein product [Effrenium voratum]CAJ1420064.1 unnamed protein product [Effrenium voratum]
MAELAEATEPQATEAEACVAHDAFMFPSALKPTDLQLEDESSEEDEDTDGPNDQGVMSSIYSSKAGNATRAAMQGGRHSSAQTLVV